MTQEKIIQVKNLVARYDDEIILDDISFNVIRGEIFVIVGTSGCGKSTLLKHLIGLIKPAAGRIIIDNIDITSNDEEVLSGIFQKIGVLFQGSALLGSMTLAENVALPLLEYSNLPKNVIAKLVHEKLCMLGLSEYQAYMPSEISGGMKKRAGLARAMALNPKILFLDEPTAGLDPIKSVEIDDLIRRINQRTGTTLVIVSHALDSIYNIADRIIMINKGKKGIIAEGNPITLRDNSSDRLVKQFLNPELNKIQIR